MNLLSHLLAVGGLVGLVFFCKAWRVRKGKGKSAPEPPGAWPIVGHLRLLCGKKPFCRVLGAMADKHGPVFMIRFGVHPTLVVSSREAVKECFTTNDKAFASRPRYSSGKLLGYNNAGFGFAPYGPFWREMRKLSVIGLLSYRRLDELKHVLLSELDFFLRMVAGKRYFVNGVQANEEARHVIAGFRQFVHLLEACVPSDVLPFLEWIDLDGYLKSMKRVAEQLDTSVQGWVEEHVMKLKSDPSSRQDFIDVMLSILKDDSVFGHTRETVIKATNCSLIVGGSATTFAASACLLFLLLNHRHALERVQEELDVNVGRERWVEESDIENLVYLQAVVKKTLRLAPAAPLLVAHEAIEDCNVCGYNIPKGTRLFVNVWKLHRDPRTWSDPEKFQPERFLTSNADISVFGRHFELIPFGSGRRCCPGIALALQMLHLMVARLLQGFDITPVGMTPRMGFFSPEETPQKVMLKPRLPSQLY
ncbi:cytochrome P450 CYP82D47-like [Vitis riparia]|uniref:cytochrome P450 CYP82D47-like n=1 Tax=Vitis riparia TaxID=96939 RepID=UPI00155AE0EF|nr:cytochrome P450 CYP82D47-like [Vitis riparia]